MFSALMAHDMPHRFIWVATHLRKLPSIRIVAVAYTRWVSAALTVRAWMFDWNPFVAHRFVTVDALLPVFSLNASSVYFRDAMLFPFMLAMDWDACHFAASF